MTSKPAAAKNPSSPSSIEVVQSAAETALGIVLTLLRVAGRLDNHNDDSLLTTHLFSHRRSLRAKLPRALLPLRQPEEPLGLSRSVSP